MGQFLFTFSFVIGIAHVLVWAYPHFWRIVGDPVDTPYQVAEMTDHEIRKAIQDTGRMFREAGALQGETFLTDDGEEEQQQKEVQEMRKFRVHIRPFTQSVTVFDYDTDVSATPEEWEVMYSVSLLDGDEDNWNVTVWRYGGGIHGFQILQANDDSWPLWLSQVLSDRDIAVVADTIALAMEDYINVRPYMNGADHVMWKFTTDIELEVK